jgi:tRNA threonylcarbamoyl adenosine modification protein YeaZ
MILVLDTAGENVFIGLWDEQGPSWVSKEKFLGGRELNSLIIKKLETVLSYSSASAELRTDKQECENVVKGVIVAAGPGSFTGLRIGLSVANTIAFVRDIPVVAPSETSSIEELLQKGVRMLDSAGSQFDVAVTPHYGAEPHITKPKTQ